MSFPQVVFKGEGHGNLQVEELYLSIHRVSQRSTTSEGQIRSLGPTWMTIFITHSMAFDVFLFKSGSRFSSFTELFFADLFIAFQCDREVSYRYKYKHLRATTANIPSNILKDNRGSKLTIGRDILGLI